MSTFVWMIYPTGNSIRTPFRRQVETELWRPYQPLAMWPGTVVWSRGLLGRHAVSLRAKTPAQINDGDSLSTSKGPHAFKGLEGLYIFHRFISLVHLDMRDRQSCGASCLLVLRAIPSLLLRMKWLCYHTRSGMYRPPAAQICLAQSIYKCMPCVGFNLRLTVYSEMHIC